MGIIKYRIMAKEQLKMPVLNIYTEKENIPWLQYLMDEFCRIERANFSIRVINYLKESGNKENDIYYLRNEKSDLFQAKHNEIRFNKKTKLFMLNGFQIIDGTISKNDYLINFDLFWNAFFYLSRLHEFEISDKERVKVSGYSFKTKFPKSFIWEIPHVNILFKEFKKIIKKKFNEVSFRKEEKAILEFSHDLDYIKKTNLLVLKQTIFNLYNAITKLKGEYFQSAFKFATSPGGYWNFDYWKEIESNYNIKSIFYVYSRIKKGLFLNVYDPSYDINKNNKLKSELIKIKKDGWDIGLHGSYYSHNNLKLLKKEKESLENCINNSINKTRQHWLCYDESKTPFYHEELFKTDSTIGWNDRIGFRAGIASKYRPYNHFEKKPFNYFVIPQVIMDSNIYDYGKGNELNVLKKCFQLIDLCKDLKNTEFSISWHPRTLSKDYNWSKGCIDILNQFYKK